ncbi:hypothetical protein R1flu_009453 [Riccia fluitans]|uniref:Uncharacterized protein n=1 Tax=Riccia fluitans TaxID=41844 RepID=A0ABD1Z2J5_9MARC
MARVEEWAKKIQRIANEIRHAATSDRVRHRTSPWRSDPTHRIAKQNEGRRTKRTKPRRITEGNKPPGSTLSTYHAALGLWGVALTALDIGPTEANE